MVCKLGRTRTIHTHPNYCFVIGEEEEERNSNTIWSKWAIRMESQRKESLTPPQKYKHDLTIRARNITLEIVEATEDKVKVKSNCAGEVNGNLYSGSYNDTIEAVMMPNGMFVLTIKYIHMTHTGEVVRGTGTGSREVPDANGIAKLTGEGTMWTSAPRLSYLNGKGWIVEGDYNIKEDSFEMIQMI